MVVRVPAVISCCRSVVLLEPREPDCRRITLPSDNSSAEFRREYRSAARSPLQVYSSGQNRDVVGDGLVVSGCSSVRDTFRSSVGSENLQATVSRRDGENVVKRGTLLFVVSRD